jgi:uncharacterized protein DUF5134
MIGEERLRWLLTVLFAAVTAFHLVRSGCPGGRAAHRISEALHAITSGAMIVMIWPWGASVPAAVWILVFTMSAWWFTARAVRWAQRRIDHVFFATTMAAMIWMAAWMPAPASPYLVAASMWLAGRGLHLGELSAATSRAVRQPPNWLALCHATMSAGMGLALLAMA